MELRLWGQRLSGGCVTLYANCERVERMRWGSEAWGIGGWQGFRLDCVINKEENEMTGEMEREVEVIRKDIYLDK
jgi:hypothetical protein